MSFSETLIDGINTLYPLLWFGVPIFVLTSAALTLRNFTTKHRQNKILVTDRFDDENFNKAVKPLFRSVNTILIEKMITDGRMPASTTPEAIRAYEEEKLAIISTQDISQFEESVDFAQMQDEIINAKRSKYHYKTLYRRARVLLGALIIVAAFHFIIALAFWIASKILSVDSIWTTTFFIAWIVITLCQFAIGGVYFYSEIKLDGYGDQDA